MAINKRIIKSNDEGGGGGGFPAFNTVLYTGNGTSQTITGVGFDPDMVWVKRRDASANSHILQDTIRGGGQANTLIPDRTDALGVNGQYGYISSFGTDSFGVAAGTTSAEHTNFLNASYVAWCWKAGGAAVSVPNGTNTSSITQSVNTDAKFSITKFSGNSTAAGTFPHGLGETPAMVIVKATSFSDSWFVWHKDLSNTTTYALRLNTKDAEQSNTSFWNSTAPNSTDVSLGGGILISANYIAYCFAEVAGFSKFGSYTGTGNTSGPTVSTGFEVAFLLVKKATGAIDDWFIFDNKRTPVGEAYIKANSSDQELDYGGDFMRIDATDGFQPIWSSPAINASGETYVYMAFANQF
jgi:hypothetical protein